MVLPLGDLEKTRIVPVATYALIAINIAMYLVQADRGQEFTTAYAATPYEITRDVDIIEPFVFQPEPGQIEGLAPARQESFEIPQGPGPTPIWLTIFTAMFLHGSPLHLAGNMLFLWIFGDNVEEVLGTFGYVLSYLLCGLAGTVAQIAAAPEALIPTLGASGAIAGMMGAYIVWFPHNRVRVLIFRFLTVMPAYVVIGGWIAIQAVEGYGSIGHLGQMGGVAYLAHIGGAAAGIVIALLFRDRAIAVQAAAYRDHWADHL